MWGYSLGQNKQYTEKDSFSKWRRDIYESKITLSYGI